MVRATGTCRAAATSVHTSTSVHSLAGNDISDNGNMEGLKAIIAAIEKMPNLTSLKCAK